jgi:hypothetical protein
MRIRIRIRIRIRNLAVIIVYDLLSDAEPRIELGAALQQSEALPSELPCTLSELRRTL